MSRSLKTFLAAITSGFIAALLGTFAINQPHSRLAPLIIYFGLLSILLMIIAIPWEGFYE